MLQVSKGRKYPYILLAVAAAVLGLGLLLKPAPPEHKQAPSESELLQLQRLTQERRLRDLSSYLTDAAHAAASPLVHIKPANQSGVVWGSPRRIVTAAVSQATPTAQTWSALTVDGASIPLQAVPLQPGVPFAVFTSTAPTETASATLAVWQPQLGDWALAISRNAEGRVVFAQGIYQGVVQERCGDFQYGSIQTSAPLSAALTGGGVFTLDGQLLGVISECNHTPIVIAVETISNVLSQPASMNRQLEGLYGIRVADTPRDGATESATSDLTVLAVWRGSPGSRAGLQPGDVIVTADGKSTQSRADLETLIAQTDADHALTIRRGRRTMLVTLTSIAATRSITVSNGLTLTDTPDGRVVVSAVAGGSMAALAGIRPGDAITQIGSVSVGAAENAGRSLDGARTVSTVSLERDGRKYEVLLKHE